MATVTVLATHTVTALLEPTKPPFVASQPDQVPHPSCQYPLAALLPALALLVSLCYFIWQLYRFQHWRVASQHRATIGSGRHPQSLPDPLVLAMLPVPVQDAHASAQPAINQPLIGAVVQQFRGPQVGSIADRAEAGLWPHPKNSSVVFLDSQVEASHTCCSNSGNKSEVLEQAVHGIKGSRAIVSRDSTGIVQNRRRVAPPPTLDASTRTPDERPDIFYNQREYARRKYASSDSDSDEHLS